MQQHPFHCSPVATSHSGISHLGFEFASRPVLSPPSTCEAQGWARAGEVGRVCGHLWRAGICASISPSLLLPSHHRPRSTQNGDPKFPAWLKQSYMDKMLAKAKKSNNSKPPNGGWTEKTVGERIFEQRQHARSYILTGAPHIYFPS